jgi:hypothetical protein
VAALVAGAFSMGTGEYISVLGPSATAAVVIVVGVPALR